MKTIEEYKEKLVQVAETLIGAQLGRLPTKEDGVTRPAILKTRTSATQRAYPYLLVSAGPPLRHSYHGAEYASEDGLGVMRETQYTLMFSYTFYSLSDSSMTLALDLRGKLRSSRIKADLFNNGFGVIETTDDPIPFEFENGGRIIDTCSFNVYLAVTQKQEFKDEGAIKELSVGVEVKKALDDDNPLKYEMNIP